MKYFIAWVMLVISSITAQAEPSDFIEWLEVLRTEAKAKGISEKTIASALGGVKYQQRVIRSDRSQAEFKENYQEYISKRVSPWRIKQGQEYMALHRVELEKVAKHYGVQARFIVAIIGVETNYGTFKLPYPLFDVLSTLAYDARRGERFRKEIFASMEIIDKGFADTAQLRSSWAGALGFPQFMPLTYLDFAVDFDGDGRKNIWGHGVDLYASVAHYLKHYGWDQNEAWARKVKLPQKVLSGLLVDKSNMREPVKRCVRYKEHLYGWKPLGKWSELGVRRMNGKGLPQVDISAALIETHTQDHQGYLVYGNFCSLMRYNPSFKYALSVGALADALKN